MMSAAPGRGPWPPGHEPLQAILPRLVEALVGPPISGWSSGAAPRALALSRAVDHGLSSRRIPRPASARGRCRLESSSRAARQGPACEPRPRHQLFCVRCLTGSVSIEGPKLHAVCNLGRGRKMLSVTGVTYKPLGFLGTLICGEQCATQVTCLKGGCDSPHVRKAMKT